MEIEESVSFMNSFRIILNAKNWRSQFAASNTTTFNRQV